MPNTRSRKSSRRSRRRYSRRSRRRYSRKSPRKYRASAIPSTPSREGPPNKLRSFFTPLINRVPHPSPPKWLSPQRATKQVEVSTPKNLTKELEMEGFKFILGGGEEGEQENWYGAKKWLQMHIRDDNDAFDHPALINEIYMKYKEEEAKDILPYVESLDANFILMQPRDSCGPWSAFNLILHRMMEDFSESSWVRTLISGLVPRLHRRYRALRILDQVHTEVFERYEYIHSLVDSLHREKISDKKKMWENAYGASFLAMLLSYSDKGVVMYHSSMFDTESTKLDDDRYTTDDPFIYCFHFGKKRSNRKQILGHVLEHIDEFHLRYPEFVGAIVLLQTRGKEAFHFVAVMPNKTRSALQIIDPTETTMHTIESFLHLDEYHYKGDCLVFGSVYRKLPTWLTK